MHQTIKKCYISVNVQKVDFDITSEFVTIRGSLVDFGINDMDPAVLEREKSIFTDQAKESGKPDNIVEKMVEGRIEKFFAESCLLEQQYIKDSDRKVSDLLTEAVSTLGENIVVNRFVRFAIGE